MLIVQNLIMKRIEELKKQLIQIRENNRKLKFQNSMIEIDIQKTDLKIDNLKEQLGTEKDKIHYYTYSHLSKIDTQEKNNAYQREIRKKQLYEKIQQIQTENIQLERTIEHLYHICNATSGNN